MKIEFVVICRGWADGRQEPDYDGMYLKVYDPEFENGMGRIDWTPDMQEAKKFSSMEEVLAAWKAIPKNHRVRKTDGKPNRPLTAFNIEISPCTKDPSPS